MARADISKQVVIGLSRFGLGAGQGGLAAIGGDLRGALLDEIGRQPPVIAAGENILSTAEAYRRFHMEQEEIKALRQAKPKQEEKPKLAADASGAPAQAQGRAGANEPQNSTGEKPFKRVVVRELFQAETLARVEAGRQALTGFAERLVLFWSNHFCISARKAGLVRALAGAYEREAIRPHIFGRFSTMLRAVEKHPAMLVYLDNVQSIGPSSRGGQRRQKGLNENLAREILELHTLGVDGGYSQEDVTSFAKMLTGWRFARNEKALAEEGHFVFNPNLHEPGPRALLGVTYRQEGVEQGEAALDALARRPATARHIARKLAAHFVSDTPDPALVNRLEKTFRDTDGDLSAVSRALIEAPESWGGEQSKLRPPYEFLVASLRATQVSLKAPQINRSLISMGQPLWSPPAPNGFSDAADALASPGGMKARLDYAAGLAQSAASGAKPEDVLDNVLGPLASSETRAAVAHAESRAQGYALLLMSPEFQRR